MLRRVYLCEIAVHSTLNSSKITKSTSPRWTHVDPRWMWTHVDSTKDLMTKPHGVIQNTSGTISRLQPKKGVIYQRSYMRQHIVQNVGGVNFQVWERTSSCSPPPSNGSLSDEPENNALIRTTPSWGRTEPVKNQKIHVLVKVKH